MKKLWIIPVALWLITVLIFTFNSQGQIAQKTRVHLVHEFLSLDEYQYADSTRIDTFGVYVTIDSGIFDVGSADISTGMHLELIELYSLFVLNARIDTMYSDTVMGGARVSEGIINWMVEFRDSLGSVENRDFVRVSDIGTFNDPGSLWTDNYDTLQGYVLLRDSLNSIPFEWRIRAMADSDSVAHLRLRSDSYNEGLYKLLHSENIDFK